MSPGPDRSRAATSAKAADVQLPAFERRGDTRSAAVTWRQIAGIVLPDAHNESEDYGPKHPRHSGRPRLPCPLDRAGRH
jgi:hypothetical protein